MYHRDHQILVRTGSISPKPALLSYFHMGKITLRETQLPCQEHKSPWSEQCPGKQGGDCGVGFCALGDCNDSNTWDLGLAALSKGFHRFWWNSQDVIALEKKPSSLAGSALHQLPNPTAVLRPSLEAWSAEFVGRDPGMSTDPRNLPQECSSSTPWSPGRAQSLPQDTHSPWEGAGFISQIGKNPFIASPGERGRRDYKNQNP